MHSCIVTLLCYQCLILCPLHISRSDAPMLSKANRAVRIRCMPGLSGVAPGHHSHWLTRPRIAGRSGSEVVFVMTPFRVTRTCIIYRDVHLSRVLTSFLLLKLWPPRFLLQAWRKRFRLVTVMVMTHSTQGQKVHCLNQARYRQVSTGLSAIWLFSYTCILLVIENQRYAWCIMCVFPHKFYTPQRPQQLWSHRRSKNMTSSLMS